MASLRSVCDFAAHEGWGKAVQQYPEVHAPLRAEYSLRRAVSESLADFRFLMPAHQDNVVLNIGSDWGTISVVLAHTFRQVFALDNQLETLKFGQLRASQEGLSNVIPLHGTALQIPLPPNSVDVVVMMDALEWVPASTSDGKPYRLQAKALSEVYRVLKPGGILHIAIENRFGYPYLLGVRDLHSRLRFVTVLPRGIANLYSLWLRDRPYREWIPSWPELKRLLRNANFEHFRLYYLLPGYRNFAFMVDSNETSQLRRIARNFSKGSGFRMWQGIMMRLAILLGGQSIFFPRLSVFVRKDS